MPRPIKKATNVLVLGTRLYCEMALSAFSLLGVRHESRRA